MRSSRCEKLRGIVCAEMSIPAQFAVDVENVVHGRTKVVTALLPAARYLTAPQSWTPLAA